MLNVPNETIDVDYRPSEDEPFMNERQREYFRRKLLAWKEDILRESRETLVVLQNDNENLPDLADRASSETDRAIELRARDRQRKLIAKIDAALGRIEDGSYGYCEETGEPISLKRLDAQTHRDLFDRSAGTPRAARESLPRQLIGRRLGIADFRSPTWGQARPCARAKLLPIWGRGSLADGICE